MNKRDRVSLNYELAAIAQLSAEIKETPDAAIELTVEVANAILERVACTGHKGRFIEHISDTGGEAQVVTASNFRIISYR